MDSPKWKLLDRKIVFASRFVNVYEDKVELPSGEILEDYTVVEKPSIVIVVATDTTGNILVLREYKHGASDFLLTLPAGHIKKMEEPIMAAKRELSEETGAINGEFEYVGELFDYPSKDIHKVHVVRAKNVALTTLTEHEATETIDYETISINDLKEQISMKQWKTSSSLAAILISGILF